MFYAVQRGYIRSTPCLVEKPAKAVGSTRATWSWEQFLRVMKHVPAPYQAPLHVMFAAHLRLES